MYAMYLLNVVLFFVNGCNRKKRKGNEFRETAIGQFAHSHSQSLNHTSNGNKQGRMTVRYLEKLLVVVPATIYTDTYPAASSLCSLSVVTGTRVHWTVKVQVLRLVVTVTVTVNKQSCPFKELTV